MTNQKRYGLPYQGSKNFIAEWVVEHMPAAPTLVDLFAGGCAVTHAALESGKFKKVFANDITDAPRLFEQAVKGELPADAKRWISREEFRQLKNTDPIVRLCWSFGGRGSSYLYGRHIEPWKYAMHAARVEGDLSVLRMMGVAGGDGSRLWVVHHHEDCKRAYTAWRKSYFVEGDTSAIDALCSSPSATPALLRFRHLFPTDYMQEGGNLDKRLERLQHPQHLQHLQHLENLQRLQRLQCQESTERLDSLRVVQGDYRKCPIPKGAVIYCDPPYKDTTAYQTPGHHPTKKGSGFDHAAFFSWVRSRREKVIISEYYIDPAEGFTLIAERKKPRIMNSNGTDGYATERLYGWNIKPSDLNSLFLL
ncbi:MAG: DNA adenine methylase [Bacteroidales bacterium]|nr:DNA adenine methylase [Bacteroidales bacterium]